MRNVEAPNLTGVHVTSVCGCLRRAFYEQVSPLPPTKRMKLYRVIGLRLQRDFYGKSNSAKEIVLPLGDRAIIASPDNWKDKADFKHSRKFVQSEDLFEGYKHQGAFYAWVYGRHSWTFDILFVGRSYPKKKGVPDWAPSSATEADDCKAPVLLSFEVEFEEEEQEELVNYVLDRAELLFAYVDLFEARLKAGATEVVCEPPAEKSWMCSECPYTFLCGVADDRED